MNQIERGADLLRQSQQYESRAKMQEGDDKGLQKLYKNIVDSDPLVLKFIRDVHRFLSQEAGSRKPQNKEEEFFYQNCSNFFEKNFQKYSYEIPLSTKEIETLRKHNEGNGNIFKKIVETIMATAIRDKLIHGIMHSEKLSQEEVENMVEFFHASKYDDTFGGIDYIFSVSKGGSTEYFGIDLAVSENKEYLNKKDVKITSQAKEFLLSKEKSHLGHIHRRVISVDPETAHKFFLKIARYFQEHAKGQDPMDLSNFFHIIRKIHSQKEGGKPSPHGIQKKTKEHVSHIIEFKL